jgi:hypothetical protein
MLVATSMPREAFREASAPGFISSSCRRTMRTLTSYGQHSHAKASHVAASTTRAAREIPISGGSTLRLVTTAPSPSELVRGTQESAVCSLPGSGDELEDEDIVRAPWRHGGQREQGSRSGSCGWITSFLGSPFKRRAPIARGSSSELSSSAALSSARSATRHVDRIWQATRLGRSALRRGGSHAVEF